MALFPMGAVDLSFPPCIPQKEDPSKATVSNAARPIFTRATNRLGSFSCFFWTPLGNKFRWLTTESEHWKVEMDSTQKICITYVTVWFAFDDRGLARVSASDCHGPRRQKWSRQRGAMPGFGTALEAVQIRPRCPRLEKGGCQCLAQSELSSFIWENPEMGGTQ